MLVLVIIAGALYSALEGSEKVSVQDGIYKLSCNVTTIGTSAFSPSSVSSQWYLIVCNFIIVSIYLASFFFLSKMEFAKGA